jgi:hypothetical protein
MVVQLPKHFEPLFKFLLYLCGFFSAVISEENESDASSSCSDCSSERSFELADWRGRLSLSWESIASESPASRLAPTLTPCDDASSLSDVSGIVGFTNVNGYFVGHPPPTRVFHH